MHLPRPRIPTRWQMKCRRSDAKRGRARGVDISSCRQRQRRGEDSRRVWEGGHSRQQCRRHARRITYCAHGGRRQDTGIEYQPQRRIPRHLRAFQPVHDQARTRRIINISSVIRLIGNAEQCNYTWRARRKRLALQSAARVASAALPSTPSRRASSETDMTAELKPELREGLAQLDSFWAVWHRRRRCWSGALYLASRSPYVTSKVLTVDGSMVM